MVNIGDGDTLPPEPPPSYSHCVASPTLEGSVVVNDQAQLDALDGCTTTVGDLYVQPLFYPDLRSLATVDLLGVQGNPLLPLEIFDPVLTFERRMSSDPTPPPDCSNGECAP